MEKKVVVGQILYGYDEEEWTIERVGRKYFEARSGWMFKKFHIDTLREQSDRGSRVILYDNIDKLKDEKEAVKLKRELRDIVVNNYGQASLNINQLRAIFKSIEENK